MYTRVVSLLCFEACVRKGFLKSVLRGAIGAKRANCNIVRTYEQQTVKVICRGCCCCCSHESIVVDGLWKGIVEVASRLDNYYIEGRLFNKRLRLS